ncbi:MAG: LicD family protein [Lachnospiraceae bacterium]|nr:LicD family protein [Lachnospiraceae bacterium]
MIELSEQQLKQLQKIELEMLVEVDRICKKNNIKYTIIGGTLLGAVRHGGFIPWDDDADVAMLRTEFEKFCEIIEKDLDHNRFYFQSMDTVKGYRWGYAKLRRKNTLFVRESQEHMPYAQGIFLDIFPIDGTPNNKFLRTVHDFRCFCVRKTLWSEVGKNVERNRLNRIIYKILSMIPENKVKKAYKGLILKHDSDASEVVRTLTFPAPKELRGYYRKWFAETAPIEFEGITFEGVKDYDGWLSYEFGDYMKLPPKEKQKTHPVSDIKLIDV